MVDFLDMQRDYILDNGMDEKEIEKVRKSLKVLRFGLDAMGKNIVSSVDGTITFVDRNYNGDPVKIGDVWLCTAERSNNVFYAMPLIKVTSAMLMNMSDEMQDSITEGLYAAHRKEYEAMFKEKYRQDVYSNAVAETNRKNDEIINDLRQKISELKDQLEKSRFVIDAKNSSEDDEIELSSEKPVIPASPAQAQSVQYVQTPVAPQETQFRPYTSQCVCPAPGMPEVRMTEPMFSGNATVKYRVTRTSSETIYSESFVDGKYFVHINPSRKFIVIKKHDYGSAICTDHKIRLDGLNEYAPFQSKVDLMAEYSKRYDGMLVRL